MDQENNNIIRENQEQEVVENLTSEFEKKPKMNKKYLIILNIIALTVLVMGISFLLKSSKTEPKFSQIEKCGDGVCDMKEKENLNICPEDCKKIDNNNSQNEQDKCGDGVCDEKEKSNLKICPQDCEKTDNNKEKIGFIGCSITHNAVDGYQILDGKSFWNINTSLDNNFGGGCISVWNKQLTQKPSQGEKNYWEMFENLIKENPQTEKIWWEICTCNEVSEMKYSDYLNILNNIKEIAPSIDIYVSPMPDFVDTYEKMCKSNLDDIEKIVSRMVDESETLEGPSLSTLSGSQTTTDGCHATDEGKLIWGTELMNFFDNGIEVTPISGDNIPYYVLVQHYDPVGESGYNTITKKGSAINYFETSKLQVEYASKRNVKLSIWLGVSLVEYILDDSKRIDLVGQWVKDGHELGVHHHSIYKPVLSWDGYTSLKEEEAIQIRKTFTKKEIVENYLGTQEDYMEVFHELENELAKRGVNIEIKSGVNNEQFNKKTSMPDEIIYGTASGFINNGDPGRFLQADADITKAVNEYITTGYVNGIKRKWLTHYTIGKKYLEEKAEIKFNELDSKTVFVGVNHNYQSEDIEVDEQTWFRKFVDFLHERDPNGDKSMTVTEVIESGILPEKEVEFLCEDNGGTLCGGFAGVPGNCNGNWLTIPEYPYNVYGDYSCCLGNCEW